MGTFFGEKVIKLLWIGPILLVLVLFTNCGQGFRALELGSSSFSSRSVFSKAAVINDLGLERHTVSTSSSTQVLCKDSSSELAPNFASPLTRLEIQNSLQVSLGVQVDPKLYSLMPEAGVLDFTNTHFSSLELVANDASEKFVSTLESGNNPLWSCDVETTCRNVLQTQLPMILWRRPLTYNETTLVNTVINSETQPREMIKSLVFFLVTAPQFHIKNAMHTTAENLSEVTSLFDLASRLSFSILYSAPSFQLIMDIFQQNINSREQLHKYFIAKLDEPDTQKEFVFNFFGGWLGFKSLTGDPTIFEGEAKNIFAEKEMNRILNLFKNDEPLKSIIADDNGGGIFHSKIFASSTYRDPKEGAVDNTNIVQRGLYVMSNIICMDPPGNLSPALEEDIASVEESMGFPVNGSNLEKAAYHRQDQRCNSCHRYIDKLAIGVENIGPFGNFRDTYPDNTPVDISVDPNTETGYILGGVPYASFDQYSDLLAHSVDFKSCFALKLHRRILPNIKTQIKPCLITNIFGNDENIGIKRSIANFIKSDLINIRKKPQMTNSGGRPDE